MGRSSLADIASSGAVQRLTADYAISEEVAKQVVVAFFFLRTLETVFSGDKAVWELAADKTRAWIATMLANGGVKSRAESLKDIPGLILSLA